MNILILGASGSLGPHIIDALGKKGAHLRLFARNPKRVERFKGENIEITQGDALDTAALAAALQGCDAVYAGLAGELEALARSVVAAMQQAGVKRLVWISSYGIHGEVPDGTKAPAAYANSARIVMDSALDYTIIRPQWFGNADEVNYETTSWNAREMFKNPDARISRKSIADLVARCIFEGFGTRDSLGINRR
ncbi:MAG: NAD(P)H-binding protein [Ottowia sp.]|nr:NAD(P)H-binding protein [Ottowia sp.]